MTLKTTLKALSFALIASASSVVLAQSATGSADVGTSSSAQADRAMKSGNEANGGSASQMARDNGKTTGAMSSGASDSSMGSDSGTGTHKMKKKHHKAMHSKKMKNGESSGASSTPNATEMPGDAVKPANNNGTEQKPTNGSGK